MPKRIELAVQFSSVQFSSFCSLSTRLAVHVTASFVSFVFVALFRAAFMRNKVHIKP